MDVFVIPIGRDRYELYCEMAEPESIEPDPPPTGMIGKLRHRFTVMLRAAEERQRGGDTTIEAEGWFGRLQERIVGWVAERIAEQRLLWNLRRQTDVRASHPSDMSFEQVMTLIRRMLQRDYERHRRWLVIDTLGLIASGVQAGDRAPHPLCKGPWLRPPARSPPKRVSTRHPGYSAAW